MMISDIHLVWKKQYHTEETYYTIALEIFQKRKIILVVMCVISRREKIMEIKTYWNMDFPEIRLWFAMKCFGLQKKQERKNIGKGH